MSKLKILSMLENFLFKKDAIGNLKITSVKPFDITCEKVTLAPRTFNTSQIKAALENLKLTKTQEEEEINPLFINISEYILKDFFLSMHQSGLYNRQLSLWKTIGNVTEASFYKLQKGVFKKEDLNFSMLEFTTSSKNTCINALVTDTTSNNINDFKSNLSLAINLNKKNTLRGVFYFINGEPSKELMNQFELITKVSDLVTKCESVIQKTKDIRLNVISIEKNNAHCTFKHIFPQVRG